MDQNIIKMVQHCEYLPSCYSQLVDVVLYTNVTMLIPAKTTVTEMLVCPSDAAACSLHLLPGGTERL